MTSLSPASVVTLCIAQLKALGWTKVEGQEVQGRHHFKVSAPGAETQIFGAVPYALPPLVHKLGGPEGYPTISRKETKVMAKAKRFSQSVPAKVNTVEELLSPSEGKVTIDTKLAGKVTLTKKMVDGKLRLYTPENVSWRVYHKSFGTFFYRSIQILKWLTTEWEVRLVRSK